MFKKNKVLFIVLINLSTVLFSQNNIEIDYPQIPVMIERSENILAEIEIDNTSNKTICLDEISLSFNYNKEHFSPKALRVLYTGTMSSIRSKSTSWAMTNTFRNIGGSQQIYANPKYAIRKDECSISGSEISLKPKQPLVSGKNYFYISIEIDQVKDLSTTFDINIKNCIVSGKNIAVNKKAADKKRLAVGLRNHGDDGAYSFRIPGLATTNNGVLIATYDIRHQTTLDLQEDVDVGISRSFDGGLTWEKMQTVIDMGEWGGLPHAQNGAGDPCILVDTKTNEIYIFALWTHAMGNDKAWTSSKGGLSPSETGQLIYVKSQDDGKTWSEPVNITSQIKQPDWTLLLQGPGRAITMTDGTLVVPIQYIDSTGIPNASIMYSKNRGKTWTTHNLAKTNTTEAQVVELRSGELMLSMRDNRREFRSIATTKDFGKTWSEHSTSRKDLIDPVCMASLLNIRKEENSLKKDILLFSNPNKKERADRRAITIKASLDQGKTWKETNQVLLDQELGWGYSCLTLIDSETVGILYEGSTSQLLFQAIKVTDIVK